MKESINHQRSKEQSCIAKQSLGEKTARRHARVLQQTKAEDAEEIHAYPCQYGTHWHVGHVALTHEKAEPEAAIEEVIETEPNPKKLSKEEMFEWARRARETDPSGPALQQ